MSKVNDLLEQLDTAFDAMEQKALALTTVRNEASKAIASAQAALDVVNTKQAALIAKAAQASDDARATLDQLRLQVNERVGSLTGLGTDPRVNVR